MPPMPEIDTAAIRARAAAARTAVVTTPFAVGSGSYTVISASLADLDALLAALAVASEVVGLQGDALDRLRSDARNIRRILWPTFVRHPEPPDTGQTLAPAVKWLRDAWRAVVDAGLASGAPEEFATQLAADHARARWAQNALRLAVAALGHESTSCCYHGTDFAKSGMERGLPRCDSCKQPFRVRKALDAAAALTESERSDTASGARIDVGASGADPEGPVEGRTDVSDQSLIHADRFVRQMNTVTALRGPSAEQVETLRDAALAAGGVVVRPLIELSTSGLLWLINATVFHPRGWALALHKRGGEIAGWHLQGDGREVWVFEGNHDERFAAAQATLTPKPLGIPEFAPQDRLDLIELLTGAGIGIDDVTTMIAAMGHRLFWSDKPDPFWLERGAFIGVRRLAHELQAKLSGFIPPRRDSFLLSLFGSDVLRAAVVLMEHDRNTWPECDHVAH